MQYICQIANGSLSVLQRGNDLLVDTAFWTRSVSGVANTYTSPIEILQSRTMLMLKIMKMLVFGLILFVCGPPRDMSLYEVDLGAFLAESMY